MTATTFIGRASIALENIPDISFEGDNLTVGGRFTHGTAAELLAARDQIRGLCPNPDGTIVPIVLGKDPSLNGFYTITSASCDVGQGSLDPADPIRNATWQVQATRISDSRLPSVDLDLWGGWLTGNGMGADMAADSVPWFGINGSWVDITADTSAAVSAPWLVLTGSLPGADGSVVQLLAGTTRGFQHQRIAFAADPATWYAASCELDWSYDGGSTWAPLTGRQLPYAAAGNLLPSSWRLTNQLIRVTAHGIAGNAQFTLEMWLGAAWSTPKVFNLLHSNPATAARFHPLSSLTVTRYTEDALTVRLGVCSAPAAGSVFTPHNYSVDLTLRRGATWVEVGYQQLIPNLADTAGLSRAASEASSKIAAFAGTTVHTQPGVAATAPDSDGLTYVLGSTDNVATDTTTAHPGISFGFSGASPGHVQMLAGYALDLATYSTNQIVGMMLGDFYQQHRFVGRI